MFNSRRLAVGAAMVAGALMANASAAEAQRMRILVPTFQNGQGGTSREGGRLADQVRRQIEQMPTHAPLEERAWKNALRRYDLNERNMDCLSWRQLVIQDKEMGAGLLLCGTYDESTGMVSGEVAPSDGSDPFVIEPFPFESREQAAQHIVETFQAYTRALSLVQYCDENIRSQNWQEALDMCNQAVEVNPQSKSAHYARGSALLNMDRTEEALAAFQQVLEIDPVHSEALLAAGYTAAQLNQQDVSQQYFREYLAMNPGDTQVRLTIATRLANEGDPSGALKLIEEVTDDPDATVQMFQYAGHFAMNAGLSARSASGPAGAENPATSATPAPAGATQNPEAMEYFRKAITHYERAISMAPDSVDGTVERQLMLAYRNVGDVDKALEIGQRVASTTEDAQTLSIYADVLKDAGRVDEALAMLDRAAQLNPELPLNARRGLLLLESPDRLDDATAAFQRAIERNEMQPAQVETIAQQMAAKGFNATQESRFQQALPYFAAARQLGKAERTIGMINFFHGYTLIKQAEPIIIEGNNAAAARRAKPMFEEAKRMLQASAAYTDGTPQANTRTQLLEQVDQFIEVADALIRAGR